MNISNKNTPKKWTFDRIFGIDVHMVNKRSSLATPKS